MVFSVLCSTGLAGCGAAAPLRAHFDALRAEQTAALLGATSCLPARPSAENGPSLQLEHAPKLALQLLSSQGPQKTWQAGRGLVLLTRHGRLVRSIGLPEDQLDTAVISGADPLGTPLDPLQTYRFVMRLDLAPAQYGLTAEHEMHFVPAESQDAQAAALPLAHWRERVRVRELAQQYDQEFWLDPNTGEALRSRQQIGQHTRLSLQLDGPGSTSQ